MNLFFAIIIYFTSAISGILCANMESANSLEEITPYKFKDSETNNYKIPPSSRYTLKRENNASNIVYYFTRPKNENFPIFF